MLAGVCRCCLTVGVANVTRTGTQDVPFVTQAFSCLDHLARRRKKAGKPLSWARILSLGSNPPRGLSSEEDVNRCAQSCAQSCACVTRRKERTAALMPGMDSHTRSLERSMAAPTRLSWPDMRQDALLEPPMTCCRLSVSLPIASVTSYASASIHGSRNPRREARCNMCFATCACSSRGQRLQGQSSAGGVPSCMRRCGPGHRPGQRAAAA
jgi:hypothetical protein